MIKKHALSVLAFVVLVTAHTAHAQVQQGYAEDSASPDVQVDRSVLEDLKGYQPPPMFSASSSPSTADSVVITPTPALKAAPPVAPTLTTPKPEDILNHPIENHHVLTEQNPQMTAPVAPSIPSTASPLLPLPTDTKENKKTEKKEPVKKETPKKDDTKKSKSPDTKTKTNKTNKATQTNSGAYRPQTAKTMPAVPSIKVEKNELPPISPAMPALPPTTDNMMEHKKPSIGERLMDAALQRHIETDDSKIKETLQNKPIKTISPPKKEATTSSPRKDTDNHSLAFKNGQTSLDKNLEQHLQKEIIPFLNKETAGRIQILSFASATDGTESSARRVSLSRALAVRDYLLQQKIPPERIDVRALAAQGGASGVSSPPSDRIDIVLLK